MKYNIEVKTIDYKDPKDLSVTERSVVAMEAWQLEDTVKNFTDADIEREVASAAKLLHSVLYRRRAFLNGQPTEGMRIKEFPHE